MTSHCTAYESKHRTLKTTYQKEIIILVNRVRHPRVQGKTCTAEERRDKLRKAAGIGKYELIRRSLNGETH